MTEREALELIKLHIACPDDENDTRWQRGFLGMLRPFTGELIEENYQQLMQAIEAIKPLLKKEMLDRNLISNLWAICYFSRLWGLEEGGMLQRNNLLSSEQTKTLTKWVDDISEKIAFIICDVE